MNTVGSSYQSASPMASTADDYHALDCGDSPQGRQTDGHETGATDTTVYGDAEEPKFESLLGKQAGGRGSTVYHEAEDGEDLLVWTPEGEQQKYCGGRLLRWQCLTVTAVVVAVCIAFMSVLGLKVIGPHMASKALADSSVTFKTVDILEAEKDSFRMIATGEFTNINIPLGMDATANQMPVDVIFNNTKFGTTTFAETHIKSGVANPFNIDSRFTITDWDTWERCGKALALLPMLEWKVKGSASVSVKTMGMPVTFSDLAFSKDVLVKGFDGLKDVKILDFSMGHSTKDYVLVDVVANVSNPSFTKIDPVGDLFFNMAYKDVFMGTVTTNATVINRGFSILKMKGSFSPGKDELAVKYTNEIMSKYLQGQQTNITCTAVNSTVGIFSQVFAGVNITASLNQGPQQLIAGMNITGMSLVPLDNETVSLALNTTVKIVDPLGADSKVDIRKVWLTAEATDTLEGALLGHIVTSKAIVVDGWKTFIDVNTTANVSIAEPNPTSSPLPSLRRGGMHS